MPAALSVAGSSVFQTSMFLLATGADVWLAPGREVLGRGSWQCQAQRPQRIGRRVRRTAAAAAAASGSLLSAEAGAGCDRTEAGPGRFAGGPPRGLTCLDRACSPGRFGVASPCYLGGRRELAVSLADERLAKNEILFRSANERLDDLAPPWSKMTDYLCECSETSCVDIVEPHPPVRARPFPLDGLRGRSRARTARDREGRRSKRGLHAVEEEDRRREGNQRG